jgi:hypothetical protein
MRIYGQAILTNSLKESYLKKAISDILKYNFTLATDSSNGYKELRELLVKTAQQAAIRSSNLLRRDINPSQFDNARSNKP